MLTYIVSRDTFAVSKALDVNALLIKVLLQTNNRNAGIMITKTCWNIYREVIYNASQR